MNRKIYSAEEFLAAVKEETIFLCFPFLNNEFYQKWDRDWESYILGKYEEALTPTRPMTARELEDGDFRCPACKRWQVVVEDVALDFFFIIFKEHCQEERPSFALFYHVVYCSVKDWGDFDRMYGFWCSPKWQKILRETYDVYGARCNSPEDWISLFGEAGILFTYERPGVI